MSLLTDDQRNVINEYINELGSRVADAVEMDRPTDKYHRRIQLLEAILGLCTRSIPVECVLSDGVLWRTDEQEQLCDMTVDADHLFPEHTEACREPILEGEIFRLILVQPVMATRPQQSREP